MCKRWNLAFEPLWNLAFDIVSGERSTMVS